MFNGEPEKLYTKDPQLKREDVQMLREWTSKQAHLPSNITEYQLQQCLHSCYYRVEAAKKAIDSFFTVRSLCPELFEGLLNEKAIRNELTVGATVVLPQKTPEGDTVCMLKLLDPNPNHYDFNHQLNMGDSVLALHFHQEGPKDGLVAVLDCAGVTFAHLTRMHLSSLKKTLYFIQNGAPLRIKGIHFINGMSVLDKLLALIKPLMKSELINMIHVHSNIDDLDKFVPRAIMPCDYGGQGPSIAEMNKLNEENLIKNLDLFRWMSAQKVDETRRPGKAKDADQLFGLEGTFKKLEID